MSEILANLKRIGDKKGAIKAVIPEKSESSHKNALIAPINVSISLQLLR